MKNEIEELKLENARLLGEVNSLLGKVDELKSDLDKAINEMRDLSYSLLDSQEEADELQGRLEKFEDIEDAEIFSGNTIDNQMKIDRLSEIWNDITIDDIDELVKAKRPNDFCAVK